METRHKWDWEGWGRMGGGEERYLARSRDADDLCERKCVGPHPFQQKIECLDP